MCLYRTGVNLYDRNKIEAVKNSVSMGKILC